jgi:hypothetical protein
MSGWTCPLGLLPWVKATAANSRFLSSERTGRGQGRRVSPPEPSHRPRGPAARGPLIQQQPVPRVNAGHQWLQPQQFYGQPRACLQRWRGEHRRDNSAPVVRALSPACQSLPWPKSSLRDQATRARTTGRARAAGWIRASRTHPVMSDRLWACGFLSARGMVPRLPAGAKTNVPQRCSRLRR